MYICNECGGVFDEPNVTADYDYSGGVKTEIPCTDEDHCPYCGSQDFEEAKECPICGDYMNDDYAVCKSCLENGYTLENAMKWDTAINFFKSVFGENEINRILKNEFIKLPKWRQKEYIENYINEDKGGFAEYLADKEEV